MGGRVALYHGDCFDVMAGFDAERFAGIVTDPPFGVREYDSDDLAKREDGAGGAWRIPPSFDGARRQPVPRFTDLSDEELVEAHRFFVRFAEAAVRVLRPGGHLVVASNALLSMTVFPAIVAGGLEYRGSFIRLVRTLRGGDRPKGAEREFRELSTMPRGCYEPWGIFRKPLPRGMTVATCLRAYGTGALRRPCDDTPVVDVIESERTPLREKLIAPHPSLKPQRFLRRMVRTVAPDVPGIGRATTVLDPFAGSGSTVAAGVATGVAVVGIERSPAYVEMARDAIPALAALTV